MATLNDVANTTVFVTSNPIPEPLTTQDIFKQKLKRFDEDIYNTTVDSHLYKFLSVLCGDSGAGLINKQISYARFQDRLESTHFSDLDRLFGNVLGLPRLSEERYSQNVVDSTSALSISLDPRGQALTADQWEEVFIKDASYRSRCLMWTQALLLGGTPQGLALAAEAALSAECFVYENFYYIDAVASGDNNEPNFGNSSSNRKQFIVIPQLPESEVTPERQFYLYRLLKRLRPEGTVFTINYSPSPRIKISQIDAKSSSNYFYITRKVTGSKDVNWPAKDSSKGYWIEKDVTNEAPTFAFMQRQEYSTFFTLAGVTASEYHIGEFNKEQQSFFSHLRDKSDSAKSYYPIYSYSVMDTPLYSTNAWVNSYNSVDSALVINNYYPLNYFNISNKPLSSSNPTNFWSSNEKLQGQSDYLIFNLGTKRVTNYIDFEICQKPINLKFEYIDDNGDWVEADPSDSFEYNTEIQYLPSDTSPWLHYEVHFNAFTAQYVRITFSRRDSLFYPGESNPYSWSIDIKNTRIGHQVNTILDTLDQYGHFIPIQGVDVLGNKYTTTLTEKTPSYVIDNEPNTYWQSQPNPSPFAVESLYFDLTIAGAGQVITELYLDPITTGSSMHFYWSNDNELDWDNKLWTPIHKHFVLKRGYYYLPRPIKAKYFKIEFSKLTPIPYNTLEYPVSSNVTYKKYPSWVQNLFANLFPVSLNKNNLQYPYNSVALNQVNVGFAKPDTNFNQSEQLIPDTTSYVLNSIIQAQNSLLTATERNSVETSTRQRVANNVNIVNNTIYKNNFVQNLNTQDSVSRFIYNKLSSDNLIDSFTVPEYSNAIFNTPINQSVIDLDTEEVNKKAPIMCFPYTARHGYQKLSVPRDTRLAFIIALKTVNFYRRDYSVKYDESFYVETFDDASNILDSDFTKATDDWRFMVTVTP